MAKVELKNLTKKYGDVVAVQNMDLTIPHNEFLVLVGPSGCGKSTTLRMIAGLEEISGGEIYIGDQKVNDKDPKDRNVSMVFQNYALYPHMTVEENLGFSLKIAKVNPNDIEAKVKEAVNILGLEDLRKRKPSQLSGGQRQRVALARAIAVRPRVLLLDEPLTALDAILRDRLRVEIDILLRSLGITAIYVTHDQSEAMALGDRIVVMSNGKISQVGTPRNIYFKPANEFVADFIGTVNRIHANNLKNFNSFKGKELLFRPDDIDIVEKKNCHFTGTIKAQFFLGEKTRLIVNINSKEEISVEGKFKGEYEIGSEIFMKINTDALIELP